MKKIILLFLLSFLSLTNFAQDNWDTVVSSGLPPYQARFYDLLEYNGRIYAAADSGFSRPTLFSTAIGITNSWSRENDITPFLQGGSEDLFSRLATNGTYMFAGTANYSGGFQTPQIYRFDGTNYKDHGTIPFSQSATNYTDISAMEFFSASGAPDSIFAFVSAWTGMEVWKTSASAANPTWVNALTMPSSTSIVNDAIIFNNMLYVATCGDANGGFILRTADGLDWDTVGYGGFGNSNDYAVKTLAIYNGELYAGTQNGTDGAKLYKSSDGITFTNISLSATGIPPSQLRSVNEIKTMGNRLFVILKKDSLGVRRQYVFYSSNGSTFIESTAGTGLANTNLGSGFGETRIEPFNGSVYVTSTTPSSYGRIWRLYIPDATFTPNISAACQNSATTFTSIGSGTSHEWYENGSLLGTSSTYSVTNGSTGTVNIKLKVFNGQINDSSEITYFVLPLPTVAFSAAPSLTVCPGEPITITATGSGTTGFYTYNWTTFSPGFPSPGTNVSTFTLAPAVVGSYTLSTTDDNGCTSNSSNVFINFSGPPANISGTVTYTGGPVTNGNVYLLKYQPTYSGTDTLAVLPLAANGTFSQTGVLYGNYLLKADPDITIAPLANTISTYNGNTFRWDSAVPFLHTCAANIIENIQVLELPAQNGTATISGYLTEGVGYGQRLMNPQHNPFVVPGGPLKGIDVKLGKNPGGGIQARTTSDTSNAGGGRFEFTNVPVGNYRIYVDIPNLPMDSLREVSVVSGTDSIPNNNYMADSVVIYIENSVGIKNNSATQLNTIKLFPNPASDRITIAYELENASEVKITVCDIVGKTISLNEVNTKQQKGKHEQYMQVDQLPAGVYFVRLQINNNYNSYKLTVTK